MRTVFTLRQRVSDDLSIIVHVYIALSSVHSIYLQHVIVYGLLALQKMRSACTDLHIAKHSDEPNVCTPCGAEMAVVLGHGSTLPPDCAQSLSRSWDWLSRGVRENSKKPVTKRQLFTVVQSKNIVGREPGPCARIPLNGFRKRHALPAISCNAWILRALQPCKLFSYSLYLLNFCWVPQ